jgi:hypothetical protein
VTDIGGHDPLAVIPEVRDHGSLRIGKRQIAYQALPRHPVGHAEFAAVDAGDQLQQVPHFVTGHGQRSPG